jgi:class 3 adenylate cyclase
MGTIEELLRRRTELLREIDQEILKSHTREVTLLFTDIVGSTQFYEKMGDIAGRQMVQTHNDLLFPIIASFDGQVIKTIGDSIMASFADPARAVRCTVEMQKAILRHNEDPSTAHRFHVRMGLHSGRAVVDEKDLFGDAVNTAARVESKAEGDEIIVSGTVKMCVREEEMPFVYLGSGAVKGKEEELEFYLVNWQERTQEDIEDSWRMRQKMPPPASGEPAPRRPRAEIRKGPEPGREAGRESVGQPGRGPVPTAPLSPRGNPYLNRVMVADPGMFFGRRALVRRIMSRLSAQKPQSISLVGERRIGKSSLLNFLRSPGALPEPSEQTGSFLFLLIDFQQARRLDAGQFFSLIFSELRRQHPGRVDIDLPAEDEGMRLLCEAAAARGLSLVFLFDEFECVTKNENIRPELYSFLRSLANTFPVAFVTASGRDLKDMCVSHEISDSPFFNIFTVQHVGLLQEGDAEALISGPSEARGVPLAPLEEKILRMGGLHPFFLQMACAAWFEYLELEGAHAEELKEKPVPQDVLEAFREEARPHLEFVVESLPPGERTALLSSARQELMDETPDARALERKGYLQRTGGKLAPFSGEFQDFLLRMGR